MSARRDAYGQTEHRLVRLAGLVEALEIAVHAHPHLNNQLFGTGAVRELVNALEDAVKAAHAAHEGEWVLLVEAERASSGRMGEGMAEVKGATA